MDQWDQGDMSDTPVRWWGAWHVPGGSQTVGGGDRFRPKIPMSEAGSEANFPLPQPLKLLTFQACVIWMDQRNQGDMSDSSFWCKKS